MIAATSLVRQWLQSYGMTTSAETPNTLMKSAYSFYESLGDYKRDGNTN